MKMTTLAYLHYEDFINLLKKYPLDYETYIMIKDSQNIYNNFGRVDIQCFNCEEYSHSLIDCPYVFLKNDRNFIIRRQIYENNKIQKERGKNKFQKPKFNSYMKQKDVWVAIVKIHIYVDDLEKYLNSNSSSENESSYDTG